MPDFDSLLSAHASRVGETLEALLGERSSGAEVMRPPRLMEAMQYSVLSGGKRIRPFFLMECARLFDVDPAVSVRAAAALECIHCYSLVHDDLPAMDDDDLRRGKPTTHVAYDEAMAILAGDGLLTMAFDIIVHPDTHPDAEVRSRLVGLFAQNAGAGGMVGGQVLDIAAESKTLTEPEILQLQAMKTGALIRCACEAGAILGEASPEEQAILLEYGHLTGQAFQLADDILDVTSDQQTMGKKTAKDAIAGKGTLVSLLGLDASRKRALELLEQAIATLEPFGQRASVLIDVARFTVERKN